MTPARVAELNAQRIATLVPAAQAKARAHLAALEARGHVVLVTQARRSSDDQAKLWALGRTAPGPIVTHAPPGTSPHEFGCAWDIAPVIDGVAQWPDAWPWSEADALADELGDVECGGRWAHPKTDRPHFELAGGIARWRSEATCVC